MDQIFTLFIADDQHMKVFLCFRINIFFNCDHQSGHRCLIFPGPIFAGDDRIRSEYFGGCESWPGCPGQAQDSEVSASTIHQYHRYPSSRTLQRVKQQDQIF